MAVIESVLARNYVEFVARGVQGVSAAIDGVRNRLNQVREIAERAAAPFAKLAAVSGAFVGFFARAALKDTVEGERLGKTFDALARTVGEIFVPYARRLTEILGFVTEQFRQLDPATKNQIAQFALITAGVAAFAATLPAVIAGVSGVLSVFSTLLQVVPALLSGFASLPGLILLLAGGFIYLTAEGDTLEKKLVSIAKTAQKVFAGTVGILSGMKAFIGGIFETGSIDRASERADRALDNALKEFDYFGERAGSLPKLVESGMDRFRGVVNEIQDRIRQIREGVGVLGQAGNLLSKPLDFSPPTAKATVKVGFETLQGTFDRLQKSLGGQEDVEQEQLKALQQILREGVLIRNLPGVVI